VLGLVFALVVLAAGLLAVRAARLPDHLAPSAGLGVLAIITTWCAMLGVAPLARSALVAALAGGGVLLWLAGWRRQRRGPRRTDLVVVAAALGPGLLLGVAFAGLAVPASNHDGAFHVETIDALRRGQPLGGWYPIGFHASAAAVLGLAPWVDTARGTTELAEGLTVLAPLCTYGLARALGQPRRIAATAAAVLAVTFVFPYDFQVWGGWPLATGILLWCGLIAVALDWLRRPHWRWAAAAGVLAGAIVLSHGTEVYSALVGLLAIGLLRWRRLAPGQLVRHVPVALGLAVLSGLPYLATLLSWAQGGGASGVGAEIADYSLLHPDDMGRLDWLQQALGVTGAATVLDLPLRGLCLGLGCTSRRARLGLGVWLAFVVVLVASDFIEVPLIQRIFTVTYPWLVDHRLRQVAVILASVLVAGGLGRAWGWLRRLRPRLAGAPHRWRRLALAGALVVGFFAEGGTVSIAKRLSDDLASQTAYSSDDGAAMAWLRQHVRPGEVLVNDAATDAGIWAPYKAGTPILLPRSADGAAVEQRAPIVAHVLDLDSSPSLEASVCALHADLIYDGARPLPYDPRELPPRPALEQAPALEEVFRSGQAVVFRVHVPCSS